MALHIRSRHRGVNFLTGGLVVAAGFVIYLALSGSLPIHFGAPQVRIDTGEPGVDQPIGAAVAASFAQR